MKILNLTQHPATKEQIEVGVIEPYEKGVIKVLLTFDEIPTKDEMEDRAIRLARICFEENCDAAMIGGAPYFMGTLEKILKLGGIQPLYAFSKRVVKEIQKEDGSVEKKTTFKFEGFVEV